MPKLKKEHLIKSESSEDQELTSLGKRILKNARIVERACYNMRLVKIAKYKNWIITFTESSTNTIIPSKITINKIQERSWPIKMLNKFTLI